MKRKPVEHELKTWPGYFEQVIAGRKRFERRKDDRPDRFMVGDTLHLREWDPDLLACEEGPSAPQRYTGRSARFGVTYILPVEEAHVIMSIVRIDGFERRVELRCPCGASSSCADTGDETPLADWRREHDRHIQPRVRFVVEPVADLPVVALDLRRIAKLTPETHDDAWLAYRLMGVAPFNAERPKAEGWGAVLDKTTFFVVLHYSHVMQCVYPQDLSCIELPVLPTYNKPGLPAIQVRPLREMGAPGPAIGELL